MMPTPRAMLRILSVTCLLTRKTLRLIGERSEPPLSVELSEFSLYLFIYLFICLLYIYVYFRPYVVHVPLTRNAKTSGRPRRLRFNGQYNRLENGYFGSKL